jgi:hypothetical protein
VQVATPCQAMLQLQHFNTHTVAKKFCEAQTDCHWWKRHFFYIPIEKMIHFVLAIWGGF